MTKTRDKPWSYRLGNAIDNVISIFSPQKAKSRRSFRNAYFGYDAASPSRREMGFPWDGRAEGILKMSRRTLRAKARDLERNSDFMASVLEAFEREVIGPHLDMQAETGISELDDRLEELWEEWTLPENCDITEQQDFTEMMRMVLRRYWVDGGIMVALVINNAKKFPLQLQIREVDDLADGAYPVKPKEGVVFSDGVEMDRYGKPIAYWLNTVDANGYESVQPTRVPAENVIFLWKKERPSQFREVTPLAKNINTVKDLQDYDAATAFNKKATACVSVWVEKNDNSTPVGRPTNTADGKRIEEIRAGSVNYMRNGETVKTLVPTGEAAEYSSYSSTQMRKVAASQGLSLEGTTRDVTKVNYSSARQNLTADDKTYKKVKNYLAVHLYRKIYKAFVDICYLRGYLDGYGFNPDDPKMYKAKWLTEGMPWIDPLKEAQADAIRVANNMTTLREVCANHGYDWYAVIEQRERENEELKAHGLSVPTGGDSNGQSNEPDNGDQGNADGSDEGQQGPEQS